jgi:ribosomal protein S18 acetylase RimI-like enzyme
VVQYSLASATNSDFEFLYELKKIAYKEYVQQVWGWDEAFQINFYKNSLAEGNTKIIKTNEVPIGSVDVKENDKSIFISGLYLSRQYQSKGIGTAIILDLIKKAEFDGKQLELEVLRVNTKAIKFYKRLGFAMEERDKNKYFMYRRPS